MKKAVFLLSAGLSATLLHAADSQEFGRVISSKPVIHQFQIPQPVCQSANVQAASTASTPTAQDNAGTTAGAVDTNACPIQIVFQNVTVYEVEYEYAGKRYKAQLPSNPGKSIALSIAPAIAPAVDPYQAVNPPSLPAMVAPPVTQPPVMTAPPVYVVPYPYYGYPYSYPYYFPPFSVHLGIGYHRGFRH